jgi:hypothetical protein
MSTNRRSPGLEHHAEGKAPQENQYKIQTKDLKVKTPASRDFSRTIDVDLRQAILARLDVLADGT